MTGLGRLPGALAELRRLAEHDPRCLEGEGCKCGLDDLAVELEGLVRSAVDLEGRHDRTVARTKELAADRDQIAKTAREISRSRRELVWSLRELRGRAENAGVLSFADECRTILERFAPNERTPGARQVGTHWECPACGPLGEDDLEEIAAVKTCRRCLRAKLLALGVPEVRLVPTYADPGPDGSGD